MTKGYRNSVIIYIINSVKTDKHTIKKIYQSVRFTTYESNQ